MKKSPTASAKESDACETADDARYLIRLLANHVDCLANIPESCDSFKSGGFDELLDNCMLGFSRRGHDQAAVRDALEYMVAPLLAAYQHRLAYLAGRLSADRP